MMWLRFRKCELDGSAPSKSVSQFLDAPLSAVGLRIFLSHILPWIPEKVALLAAELSQEANHHKASMIVI